VKNVSGIVGESNDDSSSSAKMAEKTAKHKIKQRKVKMTGELVDKIKAGVKVEQGGRRTKKTSTIIPLLLLLCLTLLLLLLLTNGTLFAAAKATWRAWRSFSAQIIKRMYFCAHRANSMAASQHEKALYHINKHL